MVLTEFYGLIALLVFLFVPGYFLALGFFPSKKEIDLLERLVFSFVFSISFIPLIVLIVNQLLGIKIDFVSVFAIIVFLIFIGLISYLIRVQQIIVPEKLYLVWPKIDKNDAFPLLPKISKN